jgi:hypothetical protein
LRRNTRPAAARGWHRRHRRIFGRTDLEAVAQGFGLRGATVRDTAEVRNVHISDKVANPSIQRQMVCGHGKM